MKKKKHLKPLVENSIGRARPGRGSKMSGVVVKVARPWPVSANTGFK